MELTSQFLQRMEALGITISKEQESQLLKYYENLIEWNNVMNLTAITEFEDVLTKHFLDCASITKVSNDKVFRSNGDETTEAPYRVIDVGTGAGFPGMVLAILYPNAQFTLMDSLNKRIKFLEDTVDKLGLKNVTCVHARAEELAQDTNFRESYDLCVSRAVANIAVLSEYCLPFVKVGGLFTAYKTEKIDEELIIGNKAIKMLGGEIVEKCAFVLPETDLNRVILVIEKASPTSSKYPRKAGLPTKEPLGTTPEKSSGSGKAAGKESGKRKKPEHTKKYKEIRRKV